MRSCYWSGGAFVVFRRAFRKPSVLAFLSCAPGWQSASPFTLLQNFVGGCGAMRKNIVSGLIVILLLINLGGCSNMTNTQEMNNVIAGTIPNEITADWFNTKANEADCKLSVPLMMLKVPSKVFAATLLSARASRKPAGLDLAVRCFRRRTTMQVSAPLITVRLGRARRFST